MLSKNRATYFFVYWLPFLLWAIVIFNFSASPAKVTSQINWQDFAIKKTAHMIEYAVFTTLLYRALRKSGFDIKRAGYVALAIAILYASTDEYHQSFTPGREPTVRDVIFDATGSVIGLSLIWYYYSKTKGFVHDLAKRLELI
jgi:VanZ family protein